MPIRCEGLDLQPVLDVLACPIAPFPINYLGLPLSPVRLTRNQLQPMMDKVARHVPTWKTNLLQKNGRLILVDSTLVATAIYPMLMLNLPPWFFQRVDKILRSFFWTG